MEACVQSIEDGLDTSLRRLFNACGCTHAYPSTATHSLRRTVGFYGYFYNAWHSRTLDDCICDHRSKSEDFVRRRNLVLGNGVRTD
eukprot:scaffold11461_cov872-Chaetoceros_neogracile.AAC.1